jgi:hypothetical protein
MKEFFERVRELGNAPRADLIEKDFHIHRILREMVSKELNEIREMVLRG